MRGSPETLLIMTAALATSLYAGPPRPVVRGLDTLPLSFEANRGQADPNVKFVGRGHGFNVLFTATETIFVPAYRDKAATASVFRMRLAGANAKAQVQGIHRLPGTVNIVRGRDPKQWRTDIPTYARVRYREVYPGLDVVFYGKGKDLEYDFMLKPGVDPRTIALQFDGANGLEISADGRLVIQTPLGEVRQPPPTVYQETARGRRRVDGEYVRTGTNQVGFRLGTYNPSAAVVIDPVLVFSTYLGGASDDEGIGIAVDGVGNTYVTGSRPSARGQDYDAFVAKFAPSGSLLWITDVGADCDDLGRGLALDKAGNAYIAGQIGASCATWRLTPGAFAAKLDATGRGVYVLPFSGQFAYADIAQAIAVDGQGAAYVTGLTNSRYFPVTPNAFQRALASTWLGNGFVLKIDPRGNRLLYATYLGGSTYESANGIAVDTHGSVYVTGTTHSTDFPTTANAFQRTNPSWGISSAGFVSKLNAAGSALVYSTYLGGDSNDIAQGITVDAAGNAYVTGETESSNFPTTRGTVQPSPGDDRLCFHRLCTDAFVTKLNAAGSGLVFSTYLGGSLWEGGSRIAIDAARNVYVTGYTNSSNFPAKLAVQPRLRGKNDAFVAKLNAGGSALIHSSYLGGSGDDYGVGIAADTKGNAYVTGTTTSANFPTKNAQQARFGGGSCWYSTCSDAFVARIGPWK